MWFIKIDTSYFATNNLSNSESPSPDGNGILFLFFLLGKKKKIPWTAGPERSELAKQIAPKKKSHRSEIFIVLHY